MDTSLAQLPRTGPALHGFNDYGYSDSNRFANLDDELSEEDQSNASNYKDGPPQKGSIYNRAAGHLARTFNPYVNCYGAILAGLYPEPDKSNENFDDEDHTKNLQAFKSLARLIPGLLTKLETLENNPERLTMFGKKMNKAVNDARGSDIRGLKDKCERYVAYACGTASLTPPIPSDASKEDAWGMNHVQMGSLLCPAEHRLHFAANPKKYLEAVRAGEIILSADLLPAFAYENQEYDPEDPEKGLFRGQLLLSGYRHIFTGPSSAMKKTPGAGKTRKGNAALNSCAHVNPESIAYVVVLLYHTLTNSDDWRTEPYGVDKDELYDLVILLFADRTSNWVVETLEWWNKHVFPPKKQLTKDAKGPSAVSKILELRQKRRQAEAAEVCQLAAREEPEGTQHPTSPQPGSSLREYEGQQLPSLPSLPRSSLDLPAPNSPLSSPPRLGKRKEYTIDSDNDKLPTFSPRQKKSRKGIPKGTQKTAQTADSIGMRGEAATTRNSLKAKEVKAAAARATAAKGKRRA